LSRGLTLQDPRGIAAKPRDFFVLATRDGRRQNRSLHPWTPPMSYSSNATGILLAAGYGVEVR
jgi:hypothetical protein